MPNSLASDDVVDAQYLSENHHGDFARSEKLKFAYKWLVQPLGSQYRTQIIVDVNIPIQ